MKRKSKPLERIIHLHEVQTLQFRILFSWNLTSPYFRIYAVYHQVLTCRNGKLFWLQHVLNPSSSKQCICITQQRFFRTKTPENNETLTQVKTIGANYSLEVQTFQFPVLFSWNLNSSWFTIYVVRHQVLNVWSHHSFQSLAIQFGLVNELPPYYVHRKTKHGKGRCQYYSNSCANRQPILLGRDISRNPGPTQQQITNPSHKKSERHPAPKCLVCEKTVRRNHKRLSCEKCFDWTHARCAGTYFFKYIKANLPNSWTCPRCTLTVLPFHGQCDLNESSSTTSSKINYHTDDILESLVSKNNQLKVMYLNTQSMLSTFNEFALTITKYPLDVVTLSETLLNSNKDRQEHVSIPGFLDAMSLETATYNYRRWSRGQDTIKYKRRHDIEATQPKLEHLWIELPERASLVSS